MRASVLLACMGGLILAAMLAMLGASPHSATPASPNPLAAPQPSRENSSQPVGGWPKAQIPLADAHNCANLLQQMRFALNSDNPSDQAAVFTNQLPALIRVNPWAVARFASANETAPWHAEVMRILAQNWAAANLAAVTNWVAQISNPDERDTMLGCVCFQVAQTAPSRAIQTLEQQGLDDERRQVMLGSLARQWAAQDLPATVNWAASYPPGDARDKLFQQIALAEAQSSPPEAARTVTDHISAGPVQVEAAIAVLQQWAKQDLTGAMAWVEEFPAGELHDRAQNELAGIARWQANPAATDTTPGLQ